MNDSFLHDLRRPPPREFAERLRAELRAAEARGDATRPVTRAVKWTALAASVVVAASALTLPAVRVGAKAFLDFFRIVDVVGVAVDPSRLGRLTRSGLDLPRLLGGQIEVLGRPAAPVEVATPEAAGKAAGVGVLAPAFLPVGMTRSRIEVVGGTAMRIAANGRELEGVLDALSITDVSVPAGLDGQTATVRIPPVVHMTYRDGRRSVSFLQAQAPEVSFPAGLDLAVLANIGLRILGLDSDDAYRLAQDIDWRSTLLVPVPIAAGTFREVDVLGRTGLMVESARTGQGGGEGRAQTAILWSAGGRVFALSGGLRPEELLEMAQTVQ